MRIETVNDYAKASHDATKPTLVVIKAHWCSHCVKMQEPLKDLLDALGDRMQSRVFEHDAYNTLKAKSGEPLLDALVSSNAASKGIPYIAMSVPTKSTSHERKKNHDKKTKKTPKRSLKIVEYPDGVPRTAVNMAKFIRGALK